MENSSSKQKTPTIKFAGLSMNGTFVSEINFTKLSPTYSNSDIKYVYEIEMISVKKDVQVKVENEMHINCSLFK